MFLCFAKGHAWWNCFFKLIFCNFLLENNFPPRPPSINDARFQFWNENHFFRRSRPRQRPVKPVLKQVPHKKCVTTTYDDARRRTTTKNHPPFMGAQFRFPQNFDSAQGSWCEEHVRVVRLWHSLWGTEGLSDVFTFILRFHKRTFFSWNFYWLIIYAKYLWC